MSVSDDSAKEDAANFFRKATEAMTRKDWDTAVELMRRVVKLDPKNLLFRQVLAGYEKRKRG